jgi:predicted ester cyclase
MSAANKAVVRRWFEEVWDKKREAAIRELLHPESVLHGIGPSPSQPIRGPEGFIPFWRTFVSAFPNITIEVEDVLAEGDMVAARCHVRGTHTGEGLGIEAAGAQVAFTGMAMARIKNGQIIEGWNNFDFFALYQNLGVLQLAVKP